MHWVVTLHYLMLLAAQIISTCGPSSLGQANKAKLELYHNEAVNGGSLCPMYSTQIK